MPAHDSMLVQGSRRRADEVAVFADPFAVIAALRSPATRRRRAAGRDLRRRRAGARARPRSCARCTPTSRSLVVARFAAQAALAARARRDGDRPEPQIQLIEELAAWSGGVLASRGTACRWRIPAGSTSSTTRSASPRPFEVGVRVLRARGTIVKTGVHRPHVLGGDAALLQGDRLVGLQRLRPRGGRGRPPARHRPLPRPRPRRAHRPDRDAHAHVPAADWRDAFTACADPRRERRHQGRLRLPLAFSSREGRHDWRGGGRQTPGPLRRVWNRAMKHRIWSSIITTAATGLAVFGWGVLTNEVKGDKPVLSNTVLSTFGDTGFTVGFPAEEPPVGDLPLDDEDEFAPARWAHDHGGAELGTIQRRIVFQAADKGVVMSQVRARILEDEARPRNRRGEEREVRRCGRSRLHGHRSRRREPDRRRLHARRRPRRPILRQQDGGAAAGGVGHVRLLHEQRRV